MGMTVALRSENDSYRVDLRGDELRDIASLGHALRESVVALLGSPEPGQRREYNGHSLWSRSAEIVSELQRQGLHRLPVYYIEMVDRNTARRSNVGAAINAKIGDDFYFITLGPDTCTMERNIIGADGKLAGRSEPIDIRHREAIETEHAVLYIRKRLVPTYLTKLLQEIGGFARRHQGDVVSLTWG